MSDTDYYDVLQVSPHAGADVIEAVYRHLARKYHPDVTSDPRGERRMRDLNRAYGVLSNPERRAAYDLQRIRVQTRVAAARASLRMMPRPIAKPKHRVPGYAWILVVAAIAVIVWITFPDDATPSVAATPSIAPPLPLMTAQSNANKFIDRRLRSLGLESETTATRPANKRAVPTPTAVACDPSILAVDLLERARTCD